MINSFESFVQELQVSGVNLSSILFYFAICTIYFAIPYHFTFDEDICHYRDFSNELDFPLEILWN